MHFESGKQPCLWAEEPWHMSFQLCKEDVYSAKKSVAGPGPHTECPAEKQVQLCSPKGHRFSRCGKLSDGQAHSIYRRG